MSDVISAVRTYLLSKTAVTDRIGQRLYFDQLIQKATLPAASIDKTSERHEHSLSDRTGMVFTRISVECHSGSRITSNSIAQAMISSGIAAVKGVTNGVNIRSVMIEEGQRNFTLPPRDGSHEHQYVTAFDFMVSYLES